MASSKHHPIVYPAIALILILGYCAPGLAVEFAGGTGEPNHPYQIATAEQLIGINSDPSLYDKHFILTADIDLDPNLPGRTVFQGPVIGWPLSTRARPEAGQDGLLHGSFDGGGHIIRDGVLFKTSYGLDAGFFGRIAQEAVVRDVHLEDMIVVEQTGSGSGYYQGLLAGVNYGTVIDCSATGTLVAYQAGGLIGRNGGTVVGCYADAYICGSTVGGLVALNDLAARVVLCESNGFRYSSGLAGALVATNRGTVQYCTAGGHVSGTRTGGLVGDNSGWVRESLATATVSGNLSTGGLVSNNDGTVVNCFVTGLISGTGSDGLVASNRGTILSSYATTACQLKNPPRLRSVVVGNQAGSDAPKSAGLTGSSEVSIASYAGGTIRYVYYLDASKPQGQTGGSDYTYGVPLSPSEMKQASSFAGFDFYGDANDGFAGPWFMPPDGYPVLTWQTRITGLAGVPDVVGLSPEQATLLLEAAGFEPNSVRYEYARVQTISAGTVRVEVGAKGQVIATQPSGYLPPGSPVALIVSLGPYDFSKNPGDGSEANPYQIATAGQLDSLYGQIILRGQHYSLTADIDLTGYVYNGPLIQDFWGEFNGNGHTVRNFQFDGTSVSHGDNEGLFGIMESSGSVHDLSVDAAYFNVGDIGCVGILIGQNKGQVTRCKAAGNILGAGYCIGGLAGGNGYGGQLTDCRFSGRVRAGGESNQVGGLVGSNIGTVTRCCARDVKVSGGQYIGGLVGENTRETGIIEACYATGTVQGVDSVGGLVGRNGIPPMLRSILIQAEVSVWASPGANGTVRDCCAACSVTGQNNVGGCVGLATASQVMQESCFFLTSKDGGGPDNGLGKPLTASQMKQQASFTAWDFVDIWTICEGRDYPRLRWEGVECEEGH